MKRAGNKRKMALVDSDDEGGGGELNPTAYKKRQAQVKAAATTGGKHIIFDKADADIHT